MAFKFIMWTPKHLNPSPRELSPCFGCLEVKLWLFKVDVGVFLESWHSCVSERVKIAPEMVEGDWKGRRNNNSVFRMKADENKKPGEVKNVHCGK